MIDTSTPQDLSSNPYEMSYSYNFYFNEDTGSLTNLEITDGVLKLVSGQSTGTWESDAKTTSSDINSAYLLLIGNNLTGAYVEISADNGLNYIPISKSSSATFVTNKGKNLRVRVTITNSNTEIDSLSLLYKTDSILYAL